MATEAANRCCNLKRVFKESLARLKTGKVKILYLVTRDSATPIASTLSAVQELHDEGLFEEFGVSNFSAWQVAEASEIAARHGWIRPSVYQGMYNAITRAVEPELFKCLGNYGIRFHAYNPLAGGAFSKSFGASGAVAAGSRFDSSHVQGKLYRDRYWNDAYLDALAEIHRSCGGYGLDAVSVALRWLIHHSQLNAERNDGGHHRRLFAGAAPAQSYGRDRRSAANRCRDCDRRCGPQGPTEMATLFPRRLGFGPERSEPRQGARSFVGRRENVLIDGVAISQIVRRTKL